MKTLADRLDHALAVRQKSSADLARAIKKTESTVSQWRSGKITSMRGDTLVATAAFLDCEPKWLASGKGPSGLEEEHQGAILRSEPTGIDGGADDIEILQYAAGGAMGNGLVLEERPPGIIKSWHVDHEWLRLNVRHHTGNKNLRIVTGFGPSMKGMFNPGDPLLCDCGVTSVETDAVYFFRLGEHGFIKLLQRVPTPDGMAIRAKSKNPDYDPFDITPQMLAQENYFQVFGKVLTVWKSEVL